MKIGNAIYLWNDNSYGRVRGYSLLLSTFSVLSSMGCGHSASTAAVQHSVPQPTGPLPDPRLPVVERNHQVLAVGKYVLPEHIELPKTLSALPTATAILSDATPRALLGATIYFPEHDAKAVLTWARTFPIPIAHTGVAFWYRKRGSYLERKLPPATDYRIIDRVPSVTQSKAVWQVDGMFFTKVWLCQAFFANGAYSVENGTYPLLEHGNDLSLTIGFMKRPSYVWLPLHNHGRSIVAVGRYHLPTPIIMPRGITPLAEALTTFTPISPTFPIIRIFFPPAQEDAVYRWAKSSAVIEKSPEVRWRSAERAFLTKAENSASAFSFSEKVAPSAPPVVWYFHGSLPARNGHYSITFKGGSVLAAKDMAADASTDVPLSFVFEDYVGGSDDFGPHSPLKGEHRHISLSFGFANKPLKR